MALAVMHTDDERRIALVGLRLRLRLTQLAVSRACRVNRSSLSLWENGFANLPDETLDRIQDYLTDELASFGKSAEAHSDAVHEAAVQDAIRDARANRVFVPLSAFGPRNPELEN
jgi:transcriptional regulator with XRE-family HTH domain